MKKLYRTLAWVLTLSLLLGICSMASADTVYIWVGVRSFDTQETHGSDTGTTITNVTVKLNGRALADGMCVDGSEPVLFEITDSVETRYTYKISTDGVTFDDFNEGVTLSSYLPSSAGTLYTLYFRVIGANDPDNNVTTASYTVFYDNLSGSTITAFKAKIGDSELTDGMWINGTEPITFEVEDTVAPNTYTYQVSIDGVNFSAFTEGDALTLESSSIFFTVYFRAVGADNPVDNVKTISYPLYYDDESPVLLCEASTESRLTFYAGDSFSGFYTDGDEEHRNVSFDGGATWMASLSLYGQNVYTYAVQYSGAGTIPAGTLAVRDKAGNIAIWGEDITITGSGGGGTGTGTGSGGSYSGSSGGTTSRTVYYASSTYDTVTPYGGVDLVVETGTMQTLVIGDQDLGLTLYVGGGAPAGDVQSTFSAGFTGWNTSEAATTDAQEDTTVDTLVLTASDASTGEEGYEYRWTFDGSVYKKLAASGIDYLVFSADDQVTALSTAGFTAGIRYNMYRAAGLASKSFVYAISMGDSGLQVQVTVDGDTYTLTDDENGDFYYYDLYTGTMDMLQLPFGQESDGNAASANGQE